MFHALHAFENKSKPGIAARQNELELIERCLRLARIEHGNRDR